MTQDEMAVAYSVRRDPAELVRVARSTTSLEVLSAVGPVPGDRGAPVELVRAVLGNAACNASLAGRYATFPDVEVRLTVARWPRLNPATLQVMAFDGDDRVREAARAALEANPRPPLLRGFGT
jgi:hypothetical protein